MLAYRVACSFRNLLLLWQLNFGVILIFIDEAWLLWCLFFRLIRFVRLL